jgi:hypothetical protein
MTELVRRNTAVVDPAEAARMSKSKLVPEHLANDAASAEYLMLLGAALGIEPVSAFQHIFVFPDSKGRLKAGMSAHLMHALAVAAGHTLHFTETNAVKATAVLVRRTSDEELNRFQRMREEERRQKLARLEDLTRLYKMQRGHIRDRIEDLRDLASFEADVPLDEIDGLRKQLAGLHTQYDFDTLRQSLLVTDFDLSKMARFESTWTMNRAITAGLNGKDVWVKFGPEMLKSRAKTSVVRDGAIDVILGVKSILGEMGLTFSDDDHDELAVASALYTPEELGADVDGDGVPLRGEVIDVTQAKASKAQASLVELAEKMVERDSADQLARWAEKTAAQEKTPVEAKISRIYAVQKAAQEAGKGDEEVASGDGSASLSLHLEATVQSLRS